MERFSVRCKPDIIYVKTSRVPCSFSMQLGNNVEELIPRWKKSEYVVIRKPFREGHILHVQHIVFHMFTILLGSNLLETYLEKALKNVKSNFHKVHIRFEDLNIIVLCVWRMLACVLWQGCPGELITGKHGSPLQKDTFESIEKERCYPWKGQLFTGHWVCLSVWWRL